MVSICERDVFAMNVVRRLALFSSYLLSRASYCLLLVLPMLFLFVNDH
jgi:hypothetical protein